MTASVCNRLTGNALISYGSHIQATGHKNTELRNAKEATTESDGYTGDTYCKDCKTRHRADKLIEAWAEEHGQDMCADGMSNEALIKYIDDNGINCPDCGKPMRYLAQLSWDSIMNDSCEGTLYVEICPECKVVSMQHQQT